MSATSLEMAHAKTALSWTIRRQGDETRVLLTGDITEETEFDGLLAAISGPKVVLDLAGVRGINSLGVREWLKFVAGLQQRTASFELVNCSVAVVHQLNQTANFRGRGRVRSMFVPFFCPQCEVDRQQLVDVDADGQAPQQTPPCPECGSAMEPSPLTVLTHLPSLNQT